MGKILSGAAGAVLAAVCFLYGLGAEAKTATPWLFAAIPVLWFFGVEIPRIFVLGAAVLWFFGALGLAGSGFSDVVSVAGYRRKLRAGMTPAAVLAEEVEATSWTSKSVELAVRGILSGAAYADTVREVVGQTGETLDAAALSYKLAADHLEGRCALIRQAAQQAGPAGTPLPEIVFPAVKVAEAAGLFSSLKSGDLIYSYGGRLVETAEQLDAEAGKTAAEAKVQLGLLRYVQTTNHHPLSGVANEYAWQALHVEVEGGPLKGKFETQAGPRFPAVQPAAASPPPLPPLPVAPPPPPPLRLAERGARAAPAAAAPATIRFQCPSCAKRLKSGGEAAGRRVRCPKCATPLLVPATTEGPDE